MALREPIPDTGKTIGDIFPGKLLAVEFTGDRQKILDATARELGGLSFESG